jgi:diadenosine tetraphosphatase ApaH/serine/threonine PP2A family protein phosphatase
VRIALFTDIHGNREALSACLAHARNNAIDRHVFLGDYVGYGADPGWVVDTIMDEVERGAVALLGNHDAATFSDTFRMNELAQIAIEWTRARLDVAQRAFLEQRPLICEEGERLYVHASAEKPERWHYVTDTYGASRSFAATQARLTFCGHTHAPALFHESVTGKLSGFQPNWRAIPLTQSRRWLAVIGSVGQPRDDNPAACYAVLDEGTNELTYVRVAYDIDKAARKIRDAGLPVALADRLKWGY